MEQFRLTQPLSAQNIKTLIQGDIQGNVIIGDKNVLIGSNHGVVIVETSAEPIFESLARPDLPPRPQPILIGRHLEITVAAKALQAQRNKPVEFYGRAGLGKTTLLNHLYHHETTKDYPNGVVYLSARRGYTAEDVLQNLVDAFYRCDRPVILRPIQVRRKLQHKKAVVLLDDVALPHDELQEVFNAAPNFSFLLGSPRRHLIRRHEGQSMPLPGLTPEETLELVQQELGASNFDKTERAAILTIHRLLEGHPADMLQALGPVVAGQATLVDIATNLQQGESPQQALTFSMQAGISGAGWRVIEVLATQKGVPLHREHLAGLTNLSKLDDILALLETKHLIQNQGQRYQLLGSLTDTLQQTIPNMGIWSERMLTYLASWTEDLSPSRLLAESDTILQTIAWASTTTDVSPTHWSALWRLVRVVEGKFAYSRQWGAWERILRAGLQAGHHLNDTASQAWAMHQLGSRALCLGEYDAARSLLIQALRLRERLGDQTGATITRHNLSFLLLPPAPDSSPPRPSLDKQTIGWLIKLTLAAFLVPLILGPLLYLFLLTVPQVTAGWLTTPTPKVISFASVTPPQEPILSTPTMASPTSSPTPPPSVTPTSTPISPATETPRPTSTPLPTSTLPPVIIPPSATATITLTPTPELDSQSLQPPQLLEPRAEATITCSADELVEIRLQWQLANAPADVFYFGQVTQLDNQGRQRNQGTIGPVTITDYQIELSCGYSYLWQIWAEGETTSGPIYSERQGFYTVPLATDTPTATNTPTATDTPTPTATNTPTATDTPTPTATNTPTATDTPTPTVTNTPTAKLVVPAAPTGLVVTPSCCYGREANNWRTSVIWEAGSEAAYYEFWRQLADERDLRLVTQTQETILTDEVMGDIPPKQFPAIYAVRACNDAGCSEFITTEVIIPSGN